MLPEGTGPYKVFTNMAVMDFETKPFGFKVIRRNNVISKRLSIEGEIIMSSRKAKIGFGYHLTAYLVANAVLVWINIDTSPHKIWVQWPIAGWGIALAFHGLSLVSSSNKMNKGFFYHLGAYIIINAFLIFTNLTTSPDYLWFKYPLIAWTGMIIFHGWLVFSKKGNAEA